MKKQLISILTATAMTLSAVPYMVSAETTEIPDSTSISIEDIEIVAQGECGENAEWTLDSNGKVTISGTGAIEKSEKLVELKDEINEVIIENGITEIGADMFNGFVEIKNISLPDSLVKIGIGAFCVCTSVTSINIPDSVESIGIGAFSYCNSLKSIDIPSKVKEIEYVNIENDGFEEIKVSADNENYCSKDGILYTKDMKKLIYVPKNRKEITIPNTVEIIGDRVFEFMKIENIVIPDSVKEIGIAAFQYSSITNIILPENVNQIGYYAFHGCPLLKEITIMNSDCIILEDEIAPTICNSMSYDTALYKGVIKGNNSSTAEKYAELLKFKFVSLDSDNTTTTATTPPVTTTTTTTGELSKVKGDTNLDGKLDLSDAVLVMQSLANPEKYGLNGTNPVHMTEQGKINGDIDKNGLTNADALEIQKYILRMHDSKYFQVNVNVIVTEITDESIIVTPVADSPELKSSDKFIVPLTAISDGTTPKVDSEYSIKYDGAIMETSPAQFVEIFDMRIVG